MNIELKDIQKSYFNKEAQFKQEVIKGISMTIKQGEALAIIGPSGAGKSTLLNILGSLDQATSGVISFDGKELKEFNEKQLAEFRNRKLGFVFQSHHLLAQLNVLENVLLPSLPMGDKNSRKEAKVRAEVWLKKVGLETDLHKFPSQLSGGECQRVAVIRALINQPDILLADEPTGSLDEESAEKIGDLLKEIHEQEKVSLIMVTHSRKLAEKIGKVFELKGGGLSVVV